MIACFLVKESKGRVFLADEEILRRQRVFYICEKKKMEKLGVNAETKRAMWDVFYYTFLIY